MAKLKPSIDLEKAFSSQPGLPRLDQASMLNLEFRRKVKPLITLDPPSKRRALAELVRFPILAFEFISRASVDYLRLSYLRNSRKPPVDICSHEEQAQRWDIGSRVTCQVFSRFHKKDAVTPILREPVCKYATGCAASHDDDVEILRGHDDFEGQVQILILGL